MVLVTAIFKDMYTQLVRTTIVKQTKFIDFVGYVYGNRSHTAVISLPHTININLYLEWIQIYFRIYLQLQENSPNPGYLHQNV